MKVSEKTVENSQAFLTVEMDTDDMERAFEQSYRRLVRKAKIPGFRKGKAPRTVLEGYLGKESILEDAVNKIIPEAYSQAVKEQGIEALARPEIEITQQDPLIFKATIPLVPNVKLGEYKNISIAKVVADEITNEMINNVIDQLQHEHANWEPVERSVQFGDLATLNIESNMEDKPYINQKGIQYQVMQNASFPAPGFAEQLIGMTKEQEKEFTLQFPQDFEKEELAGKDVQFKTGILEIKEEKLPELNDDFVKEVSPDIDNVDSLRERVRTVLRMESEKKASLDYEQRVIEAAVDTSQVEYPPILVDVEIERLIEQQLQRWQLSRDHLELYLQRINKTEEELREELRPAAINRTEQSLVLSKIAEAEKIEVSKDAVDVEIENMVQNEVEKKEELRKTLNSPHTRKSIEEILYTRKTIERLTEIAGESVAEVKKKGKATTRRKTKVKESDNA